MAMSFTNKKMCHIVMYITSEYKTSYIRIWNLPPNPTRFTVWALARSLEYRQSRTVKNCKDRQQEEEPVNNYEG